MVLLISTDRHYVGMRKTSDFVFVLHLTHFVFVESRKGATRTNDLATGTLSLFGLRGGFIIPKAPQPRPYLYVLITDVNGYFHLCLLEESVFVFYGYDQLVFATP